MSGTDILWMQGSGVTRRLGQVARRLLAVLASNAGGVPEVLSFEAFMASDEVASSEVCVQLPERLAFSDTFDGRSTSYEDLQSILANRVSQLSPLKEGEQVALADIDPSQPSKINLLIIRKDILKALEEKAGELRLQTLYLKAGGETPICMSPTTLQQQQNVYRLWLIAVLGLFGSLWLSSSLYLNRLESRLEEMHAYERSLRTLATERAESTRRVTALQTLAEQGVEAQTVAARLNALQSLSEATPAEAWWEDVSLSEKDILISGTADNAARVLQVMSNAYPDHDVRFAEPIVDRGNNQQSFVLQLTERET